ncbi:MAG: hypothetical protein MJ247_01260 [Alphaproteobacteria bacterium]|nr:hypothetical protein [Alphaproteobacteria bacterium]
MEKEKQLTVEKETKENKIVELKDEDLAIISIGADSKENEKAKTLICFLPDNPTGCSYID